MPYRISPLVAAVIAALAWPAAAGAATITYRIDPAVPSQFRYSGGLIGGSFDARLEGTLQIQLDDQGVATIASFDVRIVDPQFLGQPSILGDPAGKPLANYLAHDPVGLPLAAFTPTGPNGEQPDVSTHARTLASIADLGAAAARLRFYSGYNILADSPAAFTREAGIAVRLVPEPSLLAALLLFPLAARPRLRRQ